jgi:hypothetical protein
MEPAFAVGAQYLWQLRKSRHINALQRSNDEAYSPPVAHMAIGFGDPEDDMQKLLLACRRFCTRKAALWQLCAGDLRVCRYPSPVRQPAYSCHPYRLATTER